MQLSNKIMTYRKQRLWSQEDLAEKLGVSRQSVSKWESGASVPELDKIILLAKLFGVSTDELLLDNYTAPDRDPFGVSVPAEEPEPQIPESPTLATVTKAEALAYIEETKNQAKRFAPAVSLCILSPTLLIFLPGLAEHGYLSDGVAIACGLAFLLVLVAAAVGIFITGGIALESYRHIQEEPFQPEPGLTELVKKLRQEQTLSFTTSITVGVILCIAAVLPLILSALLATNELLILATVDLLLILVAIAVFLFVKAGMVRDCYTQLLQLEDYSPANKQTEKHLGGPYWCLITAIYLGLSFYTGAWHKTWILWPCAGVLYAALCGVLNYRKENK